MHIFTADLSPKLQTWSTSTAMYLTSPLDYLTDHFKFGMSNTEHLFSRPSKFVFSTAFIISADGNLKIIVKPKTLESSWTPFFISLPTFKQTGTPVMRKYPESSQFAYAASTLISHLGYSDSLLTCL